MSNGHGSFIHTLAGLGHILSTRHPGPPLQEVLRAPSPASRPLWTLLKLAAPHAQPPMSEPGGAAPREQGHIFSCPSKAQISAQSSSGGLCSALCLQGLC